VEAKRNVLLERAVARVDAKIKMMIEMQQGISQEEINK
jgi:hypothetical protein